MCIIMSLYVIVCATLLGCGDGNALYESHSAGKHGNVNVYYATEWEITQPLYYSVIKDGKIIVPNSVFYYHDPDHKMPEFELFIKNEVAALFIKGNRAVVYMIHDFKTGESWPYTSSTDNHCQHVAKRNRLLDRIRKAFEINNITTSGE